MSSVSYSIDRSSLSLSALVLPGYPTAGLWISDDDLARPAKVWRRATADSPFVHGTVQTQATLDQAALAFTVYAQAATAAALDGLRDDLEQALFQFTFDLTTTEEGVSKVWACYCADVTWDNYDSGMAKAMMARATVNIPCHPVAS